MNRKHKFLGVYNQLWVILLWFTRSILSLWQRLLWFPDTEECVVCLSECKCYTSWYCLLFYQLIRADGKERSLLMFRASLGWNNTNLTNSRETRRFGLLSIFREGGIIVQIYKFWFRISRKGDYKHILFIARSSFLINNNKTFLISSFPFLCNILAGRKETPKTFKVSFIPNATWLTNTTLHICYTCIRI